VGKLSQDRSVKLVTSHAFKILIKRKSLDLYMCAVRLKEIFMF